jgi:starch phosphorylase
VRGGWPRVSDSKKHMRRATTFVLEVNPKMPRRLERLEELAGNLWYSWDRPTRELFSRLHPQLWDAVNQSPTSFLRRVDEQRLVDAADDPTFLSTYNRVLSAYDSYHNEPMRRNGSEWLRQSDLVAYFCAEFGFHESLPIYSGGLGILAGDHCKAASDMRMPFVGVGLLYRQGYFLQTIDAEGNQIATYHDSDFDALPVKLMRTDDGAEVRVDVELPGRTVKVRVWQARAGHVNLCFLDTDLAENDAADRDITHRLYGGDRTTRIEQEMVLGIGGVRALAALGLKPSVWHMNEGHAAFMVLERMRGLVRQGVEFPAALEAVAVNTVFTTHTAVPAGHDHFAESTITQYFESYCRDVGIPLQELLALGRNGTSGDFNMTALAVRASRFQNGVSRIHGGVSSRMLQEFWPEVPEEESSVGYITNGVHVTTFLAPEWSDLFDRFLGIGWTQRLHQPDCMARLADIPDHIFWSVHQYLKSRMLELVRERVREQHFRNQGSEAHLDRMLKLADPDDPNVLTIGFARRFATYKRAGLLFDNLDWLRELTAERDRSIVFLFAGKAHPADVPGQDVIRRIWQLSRMPEFEGRILLVEGYDLRLARRLVSGVDVWLNNPVFPLEASGTSGMKAGMNGVLNLSVLDGWWGEGYAGDNGWAIKPAAERLDSQRRDHEESRTLYEILQDHVIPLYYARGSMGYSPEWLRMAKRSIATILPQFNAARMVTDYLRKFYLPASQQGRRFADAQFAHAREVARWKQAVRTAWPQVTVRRLDEPRRRIQFGESVRMEVGVRLNGLSPEDVVAELVLAREQPRRRAEREQLRFTHDGTRTDQGEHRFVLELHPELCGRVDYSIRVYPHHAMLTHPFELGLMLWV